MGQILEEKVHASCSRAKSYKMGWEQPWFFNLDSGKTEQTSGHPKCFLGNTERRNDSLLAGFLAAMAHFSQYDLGGGNIPKCYSSRSDKSGRLLAGSLS
jgi:hypothetical protein